MPNQTNNFSLEIPICYGMWLLWIHGAFPLQWRHNERDGVSNHRRSVIYSTVCSGANQRKRQNSALVAFVCVWWWWGDSPVNSPQKGPVTRKMFPFDDAIVSRSAGQILAQYHHSDIQPRDFEVTGDLEIRRPIAKSYVRNICLLALGWHRSCVTMPIAWLDEAANLGWRR